MLFLGASVRIHYAPFASLVLPSVLPGEVRFPLLPQESDTSPSFFPSRQRLASRRHRLPPNFFFIPGENGSFKVQALLGFFLRTREMSLCFSMEQRIVLCMRWTRRRGTHIFIGVRECLFLPSSFLPLIHSVSLSFLTSFLPAATRIYLFFLASPLSPLLLLGSDYKWDKRPHLS